MSWILLSPSTIDARLAQVEAAGWEAPSRAQITAGVWRMWHRALFRSETIGMCTDHPVRGTWRARVLQFRPFRFPFLLAERAIAPWDMSGLLSGRERILRHLLGAHHDADQFLYDLEMLAIHPGAIDELRARTVAVIDGSDPRAAYLRDLCVYERYHENLLEGIDAFQRGDLRSDDPDISFTAYLAWCRDQEPA